MKAIETNYKGVLFRSRLEARWAVFFDKIGIKWEYEPEGFTNGSVMYLPDFYLSNVYYRHINKKGIYIEIKPDSYEKQETKASDWFTEPLFLFSGLPNIAADFQGNSAKGGYECWIGIWDLDMTFVVCENCGKVKIDYNYTKKCVCDCGCFKINTKLIMNAVSSALSERF